MAAAVSASFQLKCNVTETLGLGLDHPTDPNILHQVGTTADATISGSSTVPATKAYTDTIALVGGTAMIDLQSLPGPLSTTLNFTGLKIQLVKFVNPAGNTNPINIKAGAASAYNILGNVDGEVTLEPGCSFLGYFADTLPDVAAAVSEIDVDDNAAAGTDSFQVQLVAG